MENDLFDLYDRQSMMAIEVGHNSITDWCINIYDRRGKPPGNWGNPVITEQGCDRKKVFAKAYVAMTEYLSEKNGGY